MNLRREGTEASLFTIKKGTREKILEFVSRKSAPHLDYLHLSTGSRSFIQGIPSRLRFESKPAALQCSNESKACQSTLIKIVTGWLLAQNRKWRVQLAKSAIPAQLVRRKYHPSLVHP